MRDIVCGNTQACPSPLSFISENRIANKEDMTRSRSICSVINDVTDYGNWSEYDERHDDLPYLTKPVFVDEDRIYHRFNAKTDRIGDPPSQTIEAGFKSMKGSDKLLQLGYNCGNLFQLWVIQEQQCVYHLSVIKQDDDSLVFEKKKIIGLQEGVVFDISKKIGYLTFKYNDKITSHVLQTQRRIFDEVIKKIVEPKLAEIASSTRELTDDQLGRLHKMWFSPVNTNKATAFKINSKITNRRLLWKKGAVEFCPLIHKVFHLPDTAIKRQDVAFRGTSHQMQCIDKNRRHIEFEIFDFSCCYVRVAQAILEQFLADDKTFVREHETLDIHQMFGYAIAESLKKWGG